jgi:hypothetical protein
MDLKDVDCEGGKWVKTALASFGIISAECLSSHHQISLPNAAFYRAIPHARRYPPIAAVASLRKTLHHTVGIDEATLS